MAADNESAEVRYHGGKLYRISYSFRGSRHTAMPRHSTNHQPSPPLPSRSAICLPRRRLAPPPFPPRSSHREIISSQWEIRRGGDKSVNYEYRLIQVTRFGNRDMDDLAGSVTS